MTVYFDKGYMGPLVRYSVLMGSPDFGVTAVEIPALTWASAMERAQAKHPDWKMVSTEADDPSPPKPKVGGARPGAGRKPNPGPKTAPLRVLFTPEQHAAVLARGGSTWLRDLALETLGLAPDPVKRIRKQPGVYVQQVPAQDLDTDEVQLELKGM